MKGTFFTSDFVRDNSNNLRLIEVNTDTAIQAHLVGRLDWSNFISTLEDNGIVSLEIIYKSVQLPIVDALEALLPESIEVTKHLEAPASIYPFAVEDADDKFILRLAYDQGALLDSEYAAKDLNVYGLFADNTAADKVPGFYYQGSESASSYDTLADLTNDANIADVLVRKTTSLKGGDISLYKTPGGLATAKTELKGDSNIITNYYKPLGATKASSIRSYQIIYGSNLDVMFLGDYEIESILDYPTSLETDNGATVAKIERKHYSELTTEGINRAAGVLKGHSIIRQDGGSDLAENVVPGDIYASYFVNGAPDTDNYGTLFTWSHPGSELPEGSVPTGSVMIAGHESTSANNSVIRIDLTDGTSLTLGALSSILLHQTSTDTIKYLYVSELTIGDSLFDKDGNKKQISDLNVEIHDTVDNSKTFELNLESTDIFSVEGSSVIVHNGPCFPAGTKVAVEGGEKNIEDVKVGDKVFTYNHDTLEKELKEVLRVREEQGKEVFKLSTDSEMSVEATLDHPFHVKEIGYAAYDTELCNELNKFTVGKLEVGQFPTIFNEEENVTIVSLEKQADLKTVYNLDEVEGNHNFYVNGFLVHNRYK